MQTNFSTKQGGWPVKKQVFFMLTPYFFGGNNYLLNIINDTPLSDDVDNFAGHDDDLFGGPARELLPGFFVGQHGLFDFLLAHIQGEFQGEAHFTVEGNGVFLAALYQVLLVVNRIGFPRHGFRVPQLMPEFLGHVGRVGLNEHHQRFQHGARPAVARG